MHLSKNTWLSYRCWGIKTSINSLHKLPVFIASAFAYHDHSYIMHKRKIQIMRNPKCTSHSFILTHVLLIDSYPLTQSTILLASSKFKFYWHFQIPVYLWHHLLGVGFFIDAYNQSPVCFWNPPLEVSLLLMPKVKVQFVSSTLC